MKSTTLSGIEIEGSPETVTVHYRPRMVGYPEIVDVCAGRQRVRHLLSPLQLRRIRLKVIQTLGDRSFEQCRRDVIAKMKRSGLGNRRPQ